MVADSVLAAQLDYYRRVAGEYDDHAIDVPGKDDLEAAIGEFRPAGHVLELACGDGRWTTRLAERAASVTAVDAAPEMLARARARPGASSVRFVQADLFSWRPDRRFDAVFFGFWISHVPADRFDDFWSTVDHALAPGGQVFFFDDNHRPVEELTDGTASPIVERRLNDGTPFRVVKIPYEAADLERRLRALGWAITVTPTSGPFYWGIGGSAPGSAPTTTGR